MISSVNTFRSHSGSTCHKRRYRLGFSNLQTSGHSPVSAASFFTWYLSKVAENSQYETTHIYTYAILALVTHRIVLVIRYPFNAFLMLQPALGFPSSGLSCKQLLWFLRMRSDFVATRTREEVAKFVPKGCRKFFFKGKVVAGIQGLNGVMPHKRQSCLSCHTQTNQQFLQTVAEQTTEMEALRSQLRY